MPKYIQATYVCRINTYVCRINLKGIDVIATKSYIENQKLAC